MENTVELNGLTVREYARQEGITLQTAYRRLWNGAVPARQVLGRWLITPEGEHEKLEARPVVVGAGA